MTRTSTRLLRSRWDSRARLRASSRAAFLRRSGSGSISLYIVIVTAAISPSKRKPRLI